MVFKVKRLLEVLLTRSEPCDRDGVVEAHQVNGTKDQIPQLISLENRATKTLRHTSYAELVAYSVRHTHERHIGLTTIGA